MKQQIIDRFPGISCAWTDAAGKETTEYYGFADMESHTYVDEKTIFPACSISKFITAICVMRLHEQKLIDIDMPVNRYLRQWKLLAADGTESTGRVNILKDVSQSVNGKEILIVEDIIDSGNTLHFLVQYFLAKGAKDVKIVTLFDKPDRRKVEVPVEYVGMVIPDAFIVGYGLDYAEDYRTLPYVGILKPEVYEK